MRDESLTVQDRAHKLVEQHSEWILAEFARANADLMNDEYAEYPADIDDVISMVGYGYIESCASPFADEPLFDDELHPVYGYVTEEFATALYVAIEKLCL